MNEDIQQDGTIATKATRSYLAMGTEALRYLISHKSFIPPFIFFIISFAGFVVLHRFDG